MLEQEHRAEKLTLRDLQRREVSSMERGGRAGGGGDLGGLFLALNLSKRNAMCVTMREQI